MKHRLTIGLVAACLLSGGISAQHGAGSSRTCSGRVLLTDGTGAAGVAVRFFAVGEPRHEVTPTTGPDGTFTVELQSGRRYSGFAASGEHASEVLEFVAAARLAAITLRPRTSGHLRIRGADAWLAVGPLQYSLVVRARADCILPLPAGRERVELPPLPHGDVDLAVRTSTGELLIALPLEPGAVDAAVDLPAPVSVRVNVIDELGNPVAGARVMHEAGRKQRPRHDPFAPPFVQHWRTVGTTGADGGLVTHLPLVADPFTADREERINCVLAAEHAGHARTIAGWYQGGPIRGVMTDDDGDLLEFILPEAKPYRVTLREGDVPIGGERVRVVARSQTLGPDPAGLRMTIAWHVFDAVTDEDGTLEVAAMPLEADEFRVQRTITEGDDAVGFVPLPPNRWTDPEVDLATARAVGITVHGPDGKPRPGMRGYASARISDEMLIRPFGGEPRFLTGAGGTATLRLLPGRWWVFAEDGEHWAHGLVEVTAEGEVSATLTAEPYAIRELRVTDARGEPVPAARFDAYATMWIPGTPIPADLLAWQYLGEMDGRLAECATGDEAGVLRVRFARPHVTTTVGRVRSGAAQSAEMHLRVGEPLEVAVERDHD